MEEYTSLAPGTWLQPHGIGARSSLRPLNRLGSLWLAKVCGEGPYSQPRRYRLVSRRTGPLGTADVPTCPLAQDGNSLAEVTILGSGVTK